MSETITMVGIPEYDFELTKNELIKGKKNWSSILKEARENAKIDKCLLCGKETTSFCNSHTVPRSCLTNIATNGMVYHSNKILGMPLIDEDKGLNKSGTFYIICNQCDSEQFKTYEMALTQKNFKITPKMLAEIEIKNYLKAISKRLLEISLYNVYAKYNILEEGLINYQLMIKKRDLSDYMYCLKMAMSHYKSNSNCDYYVGVDIHLDYVVPIAYQGEISLLVDLEGNIINNPHDYRQKYRFHNINLCIFPQENSTRIILFNERKSTRNARFFKQLKKLPKSKQLEIINFILFAYTEDYFLSKTIQEETLKKIKKISHLTADCSVFGDDFSKVPSPMDLLNEVKEKYSYSNATTIPNLLDKKYSI